MHLLVFTNFYTMTSFHEFKKKTQNRRKIPWKLSVCLLWSSSAPAIFRSLLGLLSLEFKYYYSSFCWPKSCLVKKGGYFYILFIQWCEFILQNLIRTNFKKRGSIFCLCWLVDKVWPLEKNIWPKRILHKAFECLVIIFCYYKSLIFFFRLWANNSLY